MSSDEDITKAGRRAVRQHLIEPLRTEGMKRPRGETLEEEKTFLDQVLTRLSYMRPDMLDRLLPIVRELAGGKAKDRWPDLIAIVNHAHAIQAPPDRSDEILYSWLHSRAGVRARETGVLFATRMYIRSYRRPPKDERGRDYYSAKVLPEMQAPINREIEALRRTVSSGEAKQSEVDRLRRYDEIIETLEAIVEAGVEYRRKLAEVEAA